MKICIFGADGRTGIEVVKYAESLGFEIVAFVYSDEAHKLFSEKVVLKKGDVMKYEDVLSAIQGCDVVLSVLGHIKGSDPLMQTKGITNIVLAMKSLGLKRILSLTGTGARVEGDSPSFLDKVLNFLVTLIDKERMDDGTLHVRVLEESGLDYTVVRVLTLGKSGEDVKGYTLTGGGPAEIRTSRKKVAKIMVDLIKEEKYFGKMPVVSGQ